MDAIHLQIAITDADAIPSSGLSFYYSSVADVATAAVFSATTVLTADVDAIPSSGSCYFFAAVATATLLAAAADANPVTFSFHHV